MKWLSLWYDAVYLFYFPPKLKFLKNFLTSPELKATAEVGKYYRTLIKPHSIRLMILQHQTHSFTPTLWVNLQRRRCLLELQGGRKCLFHSPLSDPRWLKTRCCRQSCTTSRRPCSWRTPCLSTDDKDQLTMQPLKLEMVRKCLLATFPNSIWA